MMGGIVVTGGAGFIGRHVVAALQARGERVCVIDALTRGHAYMPPHGVHFAQHEVQSAQARALVQELAPRSIVHLAAQIDVGFSERNPLADATTNVLGVVNLIDAAMATQTQSFVFASSGGAIYGDCATLPTPETAQARPRSPYGVSKWCGEAYLGWAARVSALRTVSLRFGNVYGPGQGQGGEAGVITRFAYEMLAGRSPTLNGDGSQTRDFVHVDCVVRAILEAIDTPEARGAINIGSGEQTSIAQLLDLMRDATKFRGAVGKKHRSAQEVTDSCLAIERAQRELCWQPQVGLDAGIGTLIAAMDTQDSLSA